ncbi:MAG TPA: MarR family winged helix-turn-helix transcriptional regulator [Solirubrobacteraceae bacterium]|nr:MarR family winged helix-turn-helix transcriptional regulator [Solirubrobacteraceae bacterium]
MAGITSAAPAPITAHAAIGSPAPDETAAATEPIADQLGLTGPAIVQTVDRLEAAGLVERRRDPADRRSYALQPTTHGHATAREARDSIAEIDGQLDQTLGGEKQRDELNRLLRKLLHNA